MVDEYGQTKWNIDDDRMKLLSAYMQQVEFCFKVWDLKGIYEWLHCIKRVVFGDIWKGKEEESVREKFKELNRLKLIVEEETTKEKELKFYNFAEEIYEDINRYNVSAGLYFRKGRDPLKSAIEM